MSLVAIYNCSLSANLNRSAWVMMWVIASLPLWGHTQALEPNGLQTGLSVFEKISACHESASVPLRENEWPKRVRITGEDVVFMKSRSYHQLCIVGKSLNNHLFVDNPACTVLQGNSYIIKSLTVVTCVFDVTETKLTHDFCSQTRSLAETLLQDEYTVKGSLSELNFSNKQQLSAVLEHEQNYSNSLFFLIKQAISDMTSEALYAWQPLVPDLPPEILSNG